MASPRTADQVLDVAERLVQTRGYNGFSYADIATAIGITKASLHYHFPSKAELGRALIERYTARFTEALAAISDASDDAGERLDRYVQLYVDVLGDDRICLCGMLAAEYSTLPRLMQRAVRTFFDGNEAWLTAVLETGRRGGDLGFAGTAQDAARVLTGTLEGSMLLARSYGEPSRLAVAAALVMRELVHVRKVRKPSARERVAAGKKTGQRSR